MSSAKYIIAPENCTGCSLCANVCAKDAIRMVWNQNGFMVPRVDEAACVNCGLCVRRCPALQSPQERKASSSHEVQAYGVWNKNKNIHMASSSGGVFSALAEQVIAAGGCVFGVVWQDKLTATFAKAETMEEVAPMRGSKYTMAMAGTVYRRVHNELLAGRKVLFSGTPCQVMALRTYLRKDYDNLLTIDIACHGVPSRIVLEKYVEEAEKRTGKVVAHVSFREKKHSWNSYSQVKYFTDGSEEVTNLGEDEYMKLFLCDVVLNKCCYNCSYARFPRVGDISIADFWGVERVHPEWPIREGVSAVLTNTHRGAEAIGKAQNDITVLPVPFSDIYQGQRAVYKKTNVRVHPKREALLKAIHSKTNRELVLEYCDTYWLGPLPIRKNGMLGRMGLWLKHRVAALKR